MFLAEKLPVFFARAQSAGAASNNKPSRSRLEEGCWLHVSPGRSHLPTRLRAWEGDSVDRSLKNIIVRVWLNSVAQSGVSNKNSGDVVAPPGGGGMPLRREI
jgi:hypothetical protein